MDMKHIENVMARRNWFHVDNYGHIQYCPFDDRKNCRFSVHAHTVDELREIADIKKCSENDLIRARQIAANMRHADVADDNNHYRELDIELFNKWKNN